MKKTKVFCVKPNLLKLWCVGGRAAALRANRFPDRRSELMFFYQEPQTGEMVWIVGCLSIP